jgi:hypothetical protein
VDGYHASSFLQASSYTASDVLTKIKTVDGSGSGLDADTVDGYHASAFALAGHTTHVGEQLSLQQNGYFRMANGLILQWGVSNEINADANSTLTFPISFPNACLKAFVSITNSYAFSDDIFARVISYSTSAITVRAERTSNASTGGQRYIEYFAIGY